MLTWLLALLVAAIPVGTRLLVHSVIPGFHEYEAIFIYGSDVLLICLLVAGWRMHARKILDHLHAHGGSLLFVLVITGAASVVVAPSGWLGAYVVLRLVLMIAFAYAVGVLAGKKEVLRAILAMIALVALIESVIALSQFSVQGSIGLASFGEPRLLVVAGSTSTIAAEGGRLLRVYGTFPHPNVLAAFLMLGVLALGYWYLWFEQELWASLRLSFQPIIKKQKFSLLRREYLAILNKYLQHRYFYLRMATVGAMFIVVLALALSFSRAGWLAAGVSLVVLAAFCLKNRPGGALRLLLMVASCAGAVCLLFFSVLGPRAQIQSGQPAVDMRITYADIGLKIAADTFGGVGAGNQVLYSVENGLYQERGLSRVWDWEPVHNLYLLIATELGWLGLLSFLGFLGMVTWRLMRQPHTVELVCVLAMTFGIFVLGLFDHYLWDLQAGRLMLWLVVGLALSQLPASARKETRP